MVSVSRREFQGKKTGVYDVRTMQAPFFPFCSTLLSVCPRPNLTILWGVVEVAVCA